MIGRCRQKGAAQGVGGSVRREKRMEHRLEINGQIYVKEGEKSKQERLEDALLGLIEESVKTGEFTRMIPLFAHELIELWKII